MYCHDEIWMTKTCSIESGSERILSQAACTKETLLLICAVKLHRVMAPSEKAAHNGRA